MVFQKSRKGFCNRTSENPASMNTGTGNYKIICKERRTECPKVNISMKKTAEKILQKNGSMWIAEEDVKGITYISGFKISKSFHYFNR